MLDTGADETLLPDTAAATPGIDLSNSPGGTGEGIGGIVYTARYALVTFRIADNQEHREWQGWAAFTSTRLRRPLLGFGGFLQYFTTTYHGDREFVELTVNSLYPGT